MSLVALTNVVCDDAFVARFHADPRVKATELLLQERVPREAILSEPRPAESVTTAPVTAGLCVQALPIAAHHKCAHAFPVERPLYHRGHQCRRGLQPVGRYRGHPTAGRPDDGSWRSLSSTCAIRGRTESGLRPITRSARNPTASRRPSSSRRLRSIAATATSRLELEITVSSEDDVEVRRLTITNRGSQTREIEVTSYVEMVLSRPEDDLAHPAFGKLFIETEFDRQSAGLLFSRRPRAADESPLIGFHVLGIDGPRLGGAVEWETDRARFIGRGRSPANPIVLDGRALSGNDRGGPRPDRRVAGARAAARRRGGSNDVCHRCGGEPGDRARAGAKVSRRERRGARVLDGVHARPHHAAAPRTERRTVDAVRSAGVACLRDRHLAPQPARHRGQHAGSAESLGLRHFR